MLKIVYDFVELWKRSTTESEAVDLGEHVQGSEHEGGEHDHIVNTYEYNNNNHENND